MKIAITGPESTGKTSVSQSIGMLLPTYRIKPELARLYLEETKSLRFTIQEFIEICQKSAEQFEKNYENPVLFDTDMYVLKIWNDREFKIAIPEIDRCCENPFDHHFLCKPDFPWVPDPLRYGGTQEEREELFEEYVETLTRFKAPFTILEGNHQNRISTALRKIKELENR